MCVRVLADLRLLVDFATTSMLRFDLAIGYHTNITGVSNCFDNGCSSCANYSLNITLLNQINAVVLESWFFIDISAIRDGLLYRARRYKIADHCSMSVKASISPIQLSVRRQTPRSLCFHTPSETLACNLFWQRRCNISDVWTLPLDCWKVLDWWVFCLIALDLLRVYWTMKYQIKE